MVLKIGEVFLESVDSDLFPTYNMFLILFPTSKTTVAFYSFSFLFPLTYVLHFIISYSCHKFLNIFSFQITLSSILQRRTLLHPLLPSPCSSQHNMLLSILVIYSKQILVMASPPLLEKWLKFLLKLLESE